MCHFILFIKNSTKTVPEIKKEIINPRTRLYLIIKLLMKRISRSNITKINRIPKNCTEKFIIGPLCLQNPASILSIFRLFFCFFLISFKADNKAIKKIEKVNVIKIILSSNVYKTY